MGKQYENKPNRIRHLINMRQFMYRLGDIEWTFKKTMVRYDQLQP